MDVLYGGIESGGTKWVCAIADGQQNILAQTRIPTRTPQETLVETIEFFRQQQAQFGQLAAIGVGAFGPLDPNRRSPTFGHITATPKPGWSYADIVGPIQRALDLPVGFDTDVNAAALGEYRWGAAQGLTEFIYLTIGTGIGGGGMINGQLMHGLIHPEMGHIFIPHDRQIDPFDGWCPFHGDCFEGLAAGPAITLRWGQAAETLPPDHPAWELEAHYLALALGNYICILSPKRIILGGGVMQQMHLFPLLRARLRQALNGYVQANEILGEGEDYIVPPGLGTRSGLLGAIALAMQAAETA
jgi:fructokinase